jgi:hypothetical protein
MLSCLPAGELDRLGARCALYPQSVAELSALEQRCVAPFYLKMMGLNALRHDGLLSAVREVARETTDSEVAELLALHWRPRVMGAWLASGRARRVYRQRAR